MLFRCHSNRAIFLQFSAFLSQFSSLTCPTQISSSFQATVDCDPSYTFKLQEYSVPLFLQDLLKLVSWPSREIWTKEKKKIGILSNKFKVGLHSIRFSYVFCTYGKRIRFFLRTYMQTVYAHPFFCRPDKSASANFTYASSRAWLYFSPLPYVSIG